MKGVFLRSEHIGVGLIERFAGYHIQFEFYFDSKRRAVLWGSWWNCTAWWVLAEPETHQSGSIGCDASRVFLKD